MHVRGSLRVGVFSRTQTSVVGNKEVETGGVDRGHKVLHCLVDSGVVTTMQRRNNAVCSGRAMWCRAYNQATGADVTATREQRAGAYSPPMPPPLTAAALDCVASGSLPSCTASSTK